MTRQPILGIVLLLLTASAFAQRPREITVGPEQTPQEAFKPRDVYRYPDFQDGFLVTRQRQKSQSMKINFNYLKGLLQFINERGDTVLVDPVEASLAYVGKAIFLWNDSDRRYYELLMYHGDKRLAIERTWRLARTESVHLHPETGQPTVEVSRNPTSLIYSTRYNRMIPNENRIYRRDSSYVYIDQRNQSTKANKANLLKLFSANRDQIEAHIRQSDIDFKNEEQLKALFQYCASLEK